MLSSRKQKKLQNLPSLVGVQSLQEAIQVLNARRAPKIYTSHLTNMFKVDMTNPASKTWLDQQLRETESTLKKDEKELEEMEGNHMEKKKPFEETEGNPSSGGEPTAESIAGKTGVSAQNDGPSVDDIDDKNPPATAPGGAHAQSGVSQLTEAIKNMTTVGNSSDPLNEAIIVGMSSGMTKAEAKNAALADTSMMEAVFNKLAGKVLVPIFNAQNGVIQSLKETIIAYDQKLESMRKENKGLSEAIQIKPGQSFIPVPEVQGKSSRPLLEIRNEISHQLHDDTYSI